MISLTEAKQLQSQFRERVITVDQDTLPQIIAGVDVAFPQGREIATAAIVVMEYPGLQVIETVSESIPTDFPYVPGYLSFRELPALLAAWEKLRSDPDLIFVDGQGVAHPRRFGIACHLGVVLDKPAIGVAKSRLVGTHNPVPPEKGQWVPLLDKGEIIGAVVRSRIRVKPLYISSGHKIQLSTAIGYVQACLTRYRLPEPTRLADKLSKSKSG